MQLIQFENESFSNLIYPQVVPFTPCTIVPQLFLAGSIILAFNLFKLLHKLQVNSIDLGGGSENGGLECLSLRNLHVETNEKVGEQLNIKKLAPGRTQVKHKLTKNFLIYFDSQ